MKKFTTLATLLAVSLSVSAQWSNDIIYNNQITEFGRTLYEVDVLPTSDGITYVNYNGPDGNINTWLQILDEEGNKKFDGDGLAISDTLGISWTMINERSFIDKEGNILMAVTDCRNSDSTSKLLSYAIYKVSPEGELLWGKDGLDLFKGMCNESIAFMQMTQLEDGSYIFAWMEVIGYGSDGYYQYGIKAERVSEDGTTFLWDTTMELSSSTSAYTYPYLESAGNNQFIMVYMQGSNSNVYARKMDFDGSTVWETKVYVGGFNTTTPIYLQIQTKPDPNGGVFIGWYDDRYYTGIEHAHVSYVQADGTLKLSEGTSGLQLGYSEYMRALSTDFVYNEVEDCIYAVWRGVGYSSQSYQSINVQKVSMNGELMWGSDGIEIEPIAYQSFGNLYVQNGDNGSVAVFYSEFVSSYGDTDLLAVKLDADGNYEWEGGIYEFSPTVGNKGSMSVSELINNEYWIASWEEDRIMDETSDNVAYAEKIYVTGPSSSGIAQTTTDSNLFAAKTADGTVTFATNSNEAATITIYTTTGEIVGVTTTTNGTASFGTTGLASGVYIARLASGSAASTTRFVVK